MENVNVLPDSMTSMVKSGAVQTEPAQAKKSSSADVTNTTFEPKSVDKASKVAEEEPVNTTLTQPELEEVVHEMNNVMATVQRDINFSVDEKSGRNVISVYEKGSDTLIRQLPSKEALKLLDNLEQLKGLLFKADV